MSCHVMSTWLFTLTHLLDTRNIHSANFLVGIQIQHLPKVQREEYEEIVRGGLVYDIV